MKTTARRVIPVLTLGTLLTPASAMAGGFSVARFGGEYGHAAADHVTAIYYNPAGIALGRGTRIYVEGTFAYRTADFDRDPGAIDNPGTGTPDDAIAANEDPAHLANFLASPFAGVVTDLGMRGFGLGLAIYAPFGGQAEWDKNPDYEGNTMYPGAVDSAARWANIEGAQRTLYGTLGAGWSSPRRSVAFGVGLNVISSDVSLVRARNATGTDDVLGEGRSLLEVTDLTFGVGIGAMWRPTKNMRLGISYQSKPGFGQMSLEGTLTNRFGAGETEDDVILLQRMPDVARIAAEIRASNKTRIRLAADWQNWSTYDQQCIIYSTAENQLCTFQDDGSLDPDAGGTQMVVVNIPRNWHDTFGVRAGVGQKVGETVEVAGSVSYDSSAVPDETMDPSLFDMNKVILQLGANADLGETFRLTATLGQVIYLSRTTEPRAVDPMPPSLNPDMAGEYKSSVTYLLLGLGVNL